MAVVDAAATLWCRELAFPTVRALAAHLDRQASTVLNGYEQYIELQAMVIRLEWAALIAGLEAPAPIGRLVFLADHACDLAAHDRALLRLPSFVLTAQLAAHPDAAGSAPARASMALHALASLADDTSRLRREEVERVLVASSVPLDDVA